MDSTLFVITQLTELIKLFGNIKVRYEFKKEPIVHLIEVYPKEVYQSNEDYISWESKLYDKFTEQYPLENICFISEDAFVKAENPIFVGSNIEYNPKFLGKIKKALKFQCLYRSFYFHWLKQSG